MREAIRYQACQNPVTQIGGGHSRTGDGDGAIIPQMFPRLG
jgi:hypothetical protein